MQIWEVVEYVWVCTHHLYKRGQGFLKVNICTVDDKIVNHIAQVIIVRAYHKPLGSSFATLSFDHFVPWILWSLLKYSKNVTNLFSFKDCDKNFEFYWNILRKVHTTILFFPVWWNKVINVCNTSSFQFIIMAQKYIFNCQKHEFSLKSTNWRSQCQNNHLKHFLLSPWSQSAWQYTCSKHW